jgi:hypothetical protein
MHIYFLSISEVQCCTLNGNDNEIPRSGLDITATESEMGSQQSEDQ